MTESIPPSAGADDLASERHYIKTDDLPRSMQNGIDRLDRFAEDRGRTLSLPYMDSNERNTFEEFRIHFDCPNCRDDTVTIDHLGPLSSGIASMTCPTCDNFNPCTLAEEIGFSDEERLDFEIPNTVPEWDDEPPVVEPSAEERQAERDALELAKKIKEQKMLLQARKIANEEFAAENRPERKRLLDQVLDFDRLADVQPPTPLIDHFLFQDSMAMLSATAGSYKSFIAMAQACAVATGTPWLGQEVTERRKVVYVAAEGASGVRKRMVAWCMENGVDPAELKGWMYTLPMPIQLGDRYDVEDAIEMVQELDAAMLVLDTRARCTVGLEENSATEQSIAIETLESIRLAVPGALVYVIHHGGKGGNGPRGSSAWEGAVWSDMRGEGKDLVAKIYCAKHKDAESMCKHQIHLKQVVVPEEVLPGWTVKQRTTLVVTGKVHHADSNDTPEAAEADRLGMSTVEYRERQKQAEKAAKAAEKRQAEQDDLHRAMETVSIALEIMTERIGTAEHTGRALENEIEALAHEAEALTGKIAPKIGRPMRERALDRLIAEGHFEQSDGPRNSKPYRLVSPYRIPEQRSWGELAEIHMPEDDGSGTPPIETD